jgi:hypothetical protein
MNSIDVHDRIKAHLKQIRKDIIWLAFGFISFAIMPTVVDRWTALLMAVCVFSLVTFLITLLFHYVQLKVVKEDLSEINSARNLERNRSSVEADSVVSGGVVDLDKPSKPQQEWHERPLGKFFIDVAKGGMLILIGILCKRYFDT